MISFYPTPKLLRHVLAVKVVRSGEHAPLGLGLSVERASGPRLSMAHVAPSTSRRTDPESTGVCCLLARQSTTFTDRDSWQPDSQPERHSQADKVGAASDLHLPVDQNNRNTHTDLLNSAGKAVILKPNVFTSTCRCWRSCIAVPFRLVRSHSCSVVLVRQMSTWLAETRCEGMRSQGARSPPSYRISIGDRLLASDCAPKAARAVVYVL